MAILSGIPVLNCRSIESTLDFYQQLFQFVIVKKRDLEGCLQWVHLMHGSTTLMLQRDDGSATEDVPANNISLYFFINNLNEQHHLIKAKYQHVSDIKITDYHMKEFNVIDPEGNKVTAGMALERD